MKMSSVIAQGLAGLVDRPALRRAAIEVAGRSAF
jgi:hypothetical protein